MNISVVIPAYNEEKYIVSTLASLKKQSRKPDEIIVVDGGSTDKTVHIAKKYSARVLVIPHRGIGYARQKGLLAATGDIIACTDADTVVSTNWLERIENNLSIHGVVAVVGSYRIADGAWWYKSFANTLQLPIMYCMYRLGLPTAAGQNIAFFKKAARKAGGFPISYKLVEDNEIYRRLKTQGSIVFDSHLIVTSSGRRSKEGILFLFRYFFVFFFYFLFHRGDIIGFRDYR